jgi:molecular chaperone HscB
MDQGEDYFAMFGISRAHGLDRDALEGRYLEQASAVHPDRFTNATLSDQRRALERSSAFNHAYRVLRCPVRRAEYLVKLSGIDLDSSDRDGGAPSPTQAFLIEMIELRERLAEARGDDEEELRDEIEARVDETLDEAIAALDRGEYAAAARGLVVHRYLRRFLDELAASADEDEDDA